MFWQQGSERPTPSTHAYGHSEGGREATRVLAEAALGQGFFWIRKIGRNPRRKFSRRVWKGLTPPRMPAGTGGGGGRSNWGPSGGCNGPRKTKIWKIGGNPW